MVPTLSVVIPVYNRASVIKRAVDSVLAQTFTDLEVIAVDDGSTDSTVDVLHSIRDERVHCIISPENRGAGAARNQGILAARGEYIAFLDSDDEWLPQKAALQIQLLQSLSDDWGICATGGIVQVDGSRQVVHRIDPAVARDAYRRHAMGTFSYLTPSLMLRRTCIDRTGLFDEELRRGQDSEYILRVLRHHQLAAIPDPLVICHIATNKPLSANVENSRLIIIKKHEQEIRRVLGYYVAQCFLANNYRLIAEAKLRNGETSSALWYMSRALIAMPMLPVSSVLQRLPRALSRRLHRYS